MRSSILVFLLFVSLSAVAQAPSVYKKTVRLDLDSAYQKVHGALEAQRFWVVFEADMGKRMARFAERWGEDYNRNNLTGVRSMVFCHIWWTNQIANADPDMLAMCPLHLSLYERDGTTAVVMLRPSVLARGSSAEAKAAELETELIGIIEGAFK